MKNIRSVPSKKPLNVFFMSLHLHLEAKYKLLIYCCCHYVCKTGRREEAGLLRDNLCDFSSMTTSLKLLTRVGLGCTGVVALTYIAVLMRPLQLQQGSANYWLRVLKACEHCWYHKHWGIKWGKDKSPLWCNTSKINVKHRFKQLRIKKEREESFVFLYAFFATNSVLFAGYSSWFYILRK